jgi:hypothetical protein
LVSAINLPHLRECRRVKLRSPSSGRLSSEDAAARIREAVEVAVSCIGQFDYEARGASCLVAGEYLGLAKLHLMTEQGNRVDRKGQGKHAKG